jgi:feruloyl esterase
MVEYSSAVPETALTGRAESGNLPLLRTIPAMFRRRRAPASLFFALIALAGEAKGAELVAAPDECAVLAALDFREAVGADVSLSGAMIPAAGDLPARCRVVGNIAPEVAVEVWLPGDAWNGKLLVAGCYGLCGSIRADQMEDAVARGYATATTDAGHSDQKYPDSRWAYNNPALETDFGHRAVHVTTLLAKALVRAFYGEREQHAYFRGCSTGGRQALVSAQRYPEDFDGIIAGAPFHQTLSVPHMIWADRANAGPDGRPLLRKREFTLLHHAALDACDASDGLADGIIADPEHCAFDPAGLACAEGQAGGCLSPAQVEAARKIYEGPSDSAGRRLAPFGAAAGSEATWAQQLIGRDGKPSFFLTIGQNWMRYHAFEPDPPAESGILAFDFDRDPARLAPAAERAGFEPDLERFDARDGKLIIYHGWSDESLQPAHTLDYWRRVIRENGGADKVARFARLFMLPAVFHCGGGPGAGDVDYLGALERWVEQDEAPDALIAWRTSESVPVTVRQPRFPLSGEVLMKRRVFPYPEVARYRGEGDLLDPANFLPVPPGAATRQ